MNTGETGEKLALTCKRRLVKIIAELTNRLAYSEGFKNAARKKPADFTRNRKMLFEEPVCIIHS